MRREERNLLHDLCNWKSICRLTAILESILLASLLIGLISISELIVVQIHEIKKKKKNKEKNHEKKYIRIWTTKSISAALPEVFLEHFPIVEKLSLVNMKLPKNEWNLYLSQIMANQTRHPTNFHQRPIKHNFVLYYSLLFLIVNEIPYFCLCILGTRKKSLIILCLSSAILIFVHFCVLWILSFISGFEFILQLVTTSILVLSQVSVAFILSITLRTRYLEDSIALHRASLIMRSYSDNELIVIY